LVKKFIEMERRRTQIFIMTPLKGDKMAGSYARKHSVLRQG
jgi:hypothetical protein